MTRIKLKHVHRYAKGGRVYHYFRRGDVNVRLPGLPGSKEFMEAYQAALEQKPLPIGASKTVPGSMAALAAEWYQSPAFNSLEPASQRTYRAHLEKFLEDYRDDLVADVRAPHLLKIIGKRAGTPAAANALRNVLRQLFQFAFEHGWRADNPMRDVRRLKYKKEPFPTWSEEDVATFEAYWPSGTRARLALYLMLYTGQRRSDVIRMGPQHVRGGHIVITQQKTRVVPAIPIHADLRAELATLKGDHLAFLMTERGAPFASGNAFYNWFKDCVAKAGLSLDLSPHGLRKATCCRLQEAGCTTAEIAAIAGMSLQMVEHYTKEVNRRRLAAAAVGKWEGR